MHVSRSRQFTLFDHVLAFYGTQDCRTARMNDPLVDGSRRARSRWYLQSVQGLVNGYGLQLIRERSLVAASPSFRQLMTESRASYDVAQEHAQ